MNAGTGKIEINRDYYEYCERFVAALQDNMEPVDKNLVSDILRDWYMMKTQVLAGVAVIV
jgi:hypothetical protein